MTVRREERFVTALMFSYIFGVLTFYYILDPLRKGLFLKSFPSSQLPYAYFLTALFAGIIATITFKLGQRFSAIALLTGTNVVIIGTLFYFRWAMGREIWYLPWVYFVYVKIVSVLCTTQFWLLAGYIYDNRQAKRIYSLLGAGAAVGALAGSFIPAFLSQRLSTASMIEICIGLCSTLVILSQLAWRQRRPEAEIYKPSHEEPKYKFADLWKMIFGSPHLGLMVLLIFLTLIASQIADWQVDNAVRAAYAGLPTEEMGRSIAEFSARLAFITNILSILVQVFVAGFVVRRLGILATIVFLPLALFLSSSVVFLFPSLLAVAVARGSDTVSRYSINRSGIELLYLPLAPSVRKRLKIFLDVFVDRTGRAVAGVVILLFTSSYLPLGLRGTAAVTVALTFGCVLICLRLRKTYVHAFREQLKRREVDLADLSGYVSDPTSVQFLVEALDSQNERQILYALRLLQSVRNAAFSEPVIRLLDHPSVHVREEATRTLSGMPVDCTSRVERLLNDPSPGVRDAAVDYLCVEGKRSRLESLLNDPRIEVQASAARWVADHASVEFTAPPHLIETLMSSDRVAAAGLASRLPGSEGTERLRDFLKDPSMAVAQAAAVAAGRMGHVELVFDIVDMLAIPKLRGGARQALVLYGERIVGTLGDVLRDPLRDPVLRREIAWVLARIPVKRSAELLVDNLNTEDPMFQYRIVKALSRLHETKPDLLKGRKVIADRIYAQGRIYYERLALCLAVEGVEDGKGLLHQALRERLAQDLEILFRLLAFDYPKKEIYNAYTALEGNRVERRTAAIEFLDNVLTQKLKLIILPLLEEKSPSVLSAQGAHLFGIKPIKRVDALRLIASRPDSWLRACAEYEMAAR